MGLCVFFPGLRGNVPDGDFSNKVTFNEISNFIKSSANYKIYHTLDDYFVNKKQRGVLWKKKTF